MHAGSVNKAGDTPLSLACANGHLDTVKYLVNEQYCDPRSKLIIVSFAASLSMHTNVYRYSKQGRLDPTFSGLQT